MKSSLLFALLLSATAPAHSQASFTSLPFAAQANKLSSGDRILARAFKNKTSGFMVKFRGTVVYKLPDDNDGSRHQRFLVELDSGQTLLIAHNIDLAPRVAHLKLNQTVTIYGEYIWNAKGGLVHKTHHDPDGSDPDGWIRHKGVTYQ